MRATLRTSGSIGWLAALFALASGCESTLLSAGLPVADGTAGQYCATCHGYPPPSAGHPARKDCELCHADVVGAGGVIVDPDRHMNGQIDASSVGGHPLGFSAPAAHGQAFIQGKSNCRTCHGEDLAGSNGVSSCDKCHPSGWRTNCTFCHGGKDNATGAPPLSLLGSADATSLGVGTHSKHVTQASHPAYACADCHSAVTDLLSAGHVLDATPGKAEVSFQAGLSPSGQYKAGACSSLYCHGTGRVNGAAASFAGSATTCQSCHPSAQSSSSAQEQMSGRHRKHLEHGYACAACHQGVVNTSNQIVGPNLHVNGSKDVQLLTGTYDPSTHTCSSIYCHGDKTW